VILKSIVLTTVGISIRMAVIAFNTWPKVERCYV